MTRRDLLVRFSPLVHTSCFHRSSARRQPDQWRAQSSVRHGLSNLQPDPDTWAQGPAQTQLIQINIMVTRARPGPYSISPMLLSVENWEHCWNQRELHVQAESPYNLSVHGWGMTIWHRWLISVKILHFDLSLQLKSGPAPEPVEISKFGARPSPWPGPAHNPWASSGHSEHCPKDRGQATDI